MPEDPPTPPAMPCNHLQHTDARDEVSGKSTADKAADVLVGGFLFLLVLQENQRADERTRTADLLITSLLAVRSNPYQCVRKLAYLGGFR